MLTAELVHAEGPRYAAPLVMVPGLWAGVEPWRGFAGFLGHRGWESHLLDLRQIPGGLDGRAAAVAAYAAGLGAPAVLVGHDAGGLTVLAAAARERAAAVVALAPLHPGARATRALVRSPSALAALVRGRPVPPPAGRRATLLAGDLPEPQRSRLLAGLEADGVVFVREVVWGRLRLPRAVGTPAVVVAGDRDPLLAPAAASDFAAAVGAGLRVLAGAGHWPLSGAGWRAAVDIVHRWVVQTLGEPLLELHADAMAERGRDEEEGGE